MTQVQQFNTALEVAVAYGLDVTREGKWGKAVCPACGGKILFTAEGRFMFNCGCSVSDRHGTQRKHGFASNLDYWLRNVCRLKSGQLPPARPATAQTPAKALDLKHWQGELDEGLDPTGPGQRYLNRRGLTRETCLAFGLADGRRKSPENGNYYDSVLMPYYTPDHTLVTGRHKLLGQEGQPRAATWYGGNNDHLFGQCIAPISDTLVIVEGEINAMSLHQSGVSALAIPGENCTAVTLPATTRGEYARVMVWMDKPTIAVDFTQRFDADGYVSSPVIEGVKLDANQLLQDECLAEFVEGLLWDTTDYIGEELHPITRLALEHRGAAYSWAGNRLMSVSW